MFWLLALATCWRLTPVAKNACLAKSGSIFKNLFNFRSNFLWLFTFSLNWNSPKHSVSLSTNSIFVLFHLQIFKKKVWVLISSPHISCFELHFCEYLCWCFCFSLWVCFNFWDCPCLDCWGIVLMRTCCVGFLKIIYCPICDFYLLPILFEPNPCGSFVIPLLSWDCLCSLFFFCGESGLESLIVLWLSCSWSVAFSPVSLT